VGDGACGRARSENEQVVWGRILHAFLYTRNARPRKR
jgi:hypothetical protein